MDGVPIWYGIFGVLALGAVVFLLARMVLPLWRGWRDGTVDPDALWPPGRKDPRDDVP